MGRITPRELFDVMEARIGLNTDDRPGAEEGPEDLYADGHMPTFLAGDGLYEFLLRFLCERSDSRFPRTYERLLGMCDEVMEDVHAVRDFIAEKAHRTGGE